MTLAETYLDVLNERFSFYYKMGQDALNQVTFDAMKWRPTTNDNNIAILVKHLSGNMKSRWTDFLTTDGEKSWRNRDTEFIDDFSNRQQILDSYESGWEVLFNELKALTSEDLDRTVHIRRKPHTVIAALERQYAHTAYHIGQIVLLAKMTAGEKWQTLSIPLGESEVFNKKMFETHSDPKLT